MVKKDDNIYILMMEFLNLAYPIVKVKDKGKFKRGIVINGNKFILKKDGLFISSLLFNILDLVFSSTPELISDVISEKYSLSF